MVVKTSDLRSNKLQVDPDVQVPAAVRRAAEAADAAMKAANPTPEPSSTPTETPADTITIAEPDPAPRLPNVVTSVGNPPEPPKPTEPKLPQKGPDVDEDTWKNRYESILTRFREATSQLTTANTRIDALENMLASTQNAPRAPANIQPQKLITPKDEEDMGTEMIDFVRRAAREEITNTVSSTLAQELAEIKAKLNGTAEDVALSARQRMHNALDTKLPDWQKINHDPDFHAWLALQDRFSGVNRKKLLTQAYAQNDADRVLAIFEGFISEAARPTSPSPQVTTPAPVQPERPRLEDLAAPGRARTAVTPPGPADKQFIRTSDINAFYAAIRRGAYRGREELQKQHEAELHAAMQENRIVQDT